MRKRPKSQFWHNTPVKTCTQIKTPKYDFKPFFDKIENFPGVAIPKKVAVSIRLPTRRHDCEAESSNPPTSVNVL